MSITLHLKAMNVLNTHQVVLRTIYDMEYENVVSTSIIPVFSVEAAFKLYKCII